jgi:hypothetical protein
MTGNKDCLVQAGKTTAVAGGAGLFISAIQNTMAKHSEGAKGVFTRTGGTIGFLGTTKNILSKTCSSPPFFSNTQC